MGKNIKLRKGFTIIEVVLVLAIAGLIFLMVFVAFPTAQITQHDNQRRDDYALLSATVSNFSTSNNGKLIRLVGASKLSDSGNQPKILNPSNYINSTGEDPNGYTYYLAAYTFAGWEAAGSPVPKDIHNEDTAAGGGEDDGEEATNYGSQVFVVIGADCDGMNEAGFSEPAKNNSTRAFAIFGYLESGSQTYCSASQ